MQKLEVQILIVTLIQTLIIVIAAMLCLFYQFIIAYCLMVISLALNVIAVFILYKIEKKMK